MVRMRVGMTRSTMPDRAALLEDVAAEAAEAGNAVGEVDFLRLPELLLVLGREEHARHRFGVAGDRAASLRKRRPGCH